MPRAPQLAELGAELGSVMLTRMHVRYDAEQFRSDPLLRETSDRTPVGGRCLIIIPTRARRPAPRRATSASCANAATRRWQAFAASPAGPARSFARRPRRDDTKCKALSALSP